MFFDKKLSKSSEFYYLEPGLYPSITDIVEAMNILIQERRNHSEKCIKLEESRRTQEVKIYPQMTDPVLHSLVWIWDTFSEVILLQHHWRHKGPIAALLPFYFEAQVWRHYNYWTVHELSDI